uniref:Uncharacterized protein n=1 Tax=Pseudomonas syringae pv. actinidiae TaxID=103796 RepID=A0A2P0QFV4_PSESF|nr:hypothetical protein [Pseudomonas syringae pv. actinidiae]
MINHVITKDALRKAVNSSGVADRASAIIPLTETGSKTSKNAQNIVSNTGVAAAQ